MNEATLKKYSQALVSQFVKEYSVKYGKAPSDLNRYRDRWGFQSMIEDLGKARAQELITFYLKSTRASHPVSYLLYNYDKINDTMEENEQDLENRRLLMEETRRRVEEWNGN